VHAESNWAKMPPKPLLKVVIWLSSDCSIAGKALLSESIIPWRPAPAWMI
jgi:hypothetical protein